MNDVLDVLFIELSSLLKLVGLSPLLELVGLNPLVALVELFYDEIVLCIWNFLVRRKVRIMVNISFLMEDAQFIEKLELVKLCPLLELKRLNPQS